MQNATPPVNTYVQNSKPQKPTTTQPGRAQTNGDLHKIIYHVQKWLLGVWILSYLKLKT
jgi:hypothetical protein